MSAREVDPRVEEMTRILAAELHGTVGVDMVRRCVVAASAQFADARIDAYIPLFVARHARRLIEARTHTLQGAGSNEL